MPAVRSLLTNNFVRGAVSGLGLVNVLAAVAELADMFGRRAGDSSLPKAPGELGDHHAP
jgi:hypothetical protein